MRRRAAFTLIEILIACALLALLVAIGFKALTVFKPATSEVEFSYLFSAEAEGQLQRLRDEISQTCMGSINVSQNQGHPFINFASYRDDEGNPVFNDNGAPRWSRTVYIWLQDDGSGLTGNLNRVEQVYPGQSEMAQPIWGSWSPPTGSSSVVLQNVLLPYKKLPDIPANPPIATAMSGGFQVEFLQAAVRTPNYYSLSSASTNPARLPYQGQSPDDGNAGSNFPLIRITFQFADTAPSGKTNYLKLALHIHPKY